MSIKNVIQYAISIFTGSIPAYFSVSFFSFFYSSLFSFILLSLLFSVLFQFLAFFLVGKIVKKKWEIDIASVVVILLAGGMMITTLGLCLKFPTLFDHRLLFLDSLHTLVFIGLALFSTGAVVIWVDVLTKRGYIERIRNSYSYGWIRVNIVGLVLASLFFVTYFTLAETINFPGYRTLDQYFDTDISAWLARLQVASPRDVVDEVRAVHPAVLLFLRPLVWIVSLILNGNRLHAVFIVHSLAAAMCVFLMWRIVKHSSSNTSYALMISSLLGASASHILLGSMVETYIYSALALLFFIFLLQNEMISLKSVVFAGVLVFGITVTNLVQTVILFFINQPRIKAMVMYSILVVGIVFILNLVQVEIYPTARGMQPSNLLGEQRYQVDFGSDSWRMRGRVSLMTRAVLLYGIVAPKPFILMEELGTNVPNFRTFKIAKGEFHVAGYTDLADLTVRLWMGILACAVILFILGWFGNTKPIFQLGLLTCIGFNFLLHVFYGDDPMLYSPDWVYALVLFVMFSFSRFSERKWFQILIIVFLLLEMIVNLTLVRQIMEVSVPFYGR